MFSTTGQQVEHLGYLAVYGLYQESSQTLIPSSIQQGMKILMSDFTVGYQCSQTQPPRYLTESDLISLMDKNGIGTDATIHEHIKTVQERGYVEMTKSRHLKPTPIGLALVQSYKQLGIELYKPNLRGKIEREMRKITQGERNWEEVLAEAI
jgi:DNA topoisomerase-3